MRAATTAAEGPEQGVLHALVRDPRRVLDLKGALEPDDFSTAAGAALFAVIAGVVESADGRDVASDDVAAQLDALRGVEGRAGEVAAQALSMLGDLTSIAALAPSDERLQFDVRRVRHMADVRRALDEPPGATGEELVAGEGGPRPVSARAAPSAPPLQPLSEAELEGKLRFLKHLHGEGLISDADYDRKRADLLDRL